MRISDWSSDVCSSDLHGHVLPAPDLVELEVAALEAAVLLEVHRGAGAVVVDRPSRLQRRDALGAGGDAVSRSVADPPDMLLRSEERRVGKECVSPCRARGSPYQ